MEENNNLPTIEQLSNKVDLIAQSVDNSLHVQPNRLVDSVKKNKITTIIGFGILGSHLFGVFCPKYKEVSENVKAVLEAGLGAMAVDPVIKKVPEYLEKYG
jgi:hypothetical protein